MRYQLVIKAQDRDDAREKLGDYVGAEDLESLEELNGRWVAVVEVDLGPYLIAAWEGALNHIMNSVRYDLVWWSRVPYTQEVL